MLGFIGGTGPEGRGLALRFALAGERVMIGSRHEERALQAAESLWSLIDPARVLWGVNRETAQESDIVFVAVPYSGHRATLEPLAAELTGKIVVDVVAPLAVRRGRAKAVPVEEGSAALQAQSVLPDARVVAAFQTVSAQELLVPDRAIDSDVVVCSEDAEARETVMGLAEKIQGVRAVNGGGLENARYVEDFTALLLNLNRIYKAHSTIKIGGIFP
jgi:NADPH-dependent F420 reductase